MGSHSWRNSVNTGGRHEVHDPFPIYEIWWRLSKHNVFYMYHDKFIFVAYDELGSYRVEVVPVKLPVRADHVAVREIRCRIYVVFENDTIPICWAICCKRTSNRFAALRVPSKPRKNNDVFCKSKSEEEEGAKYVCEGESVRT